MSRTETNRSTPAHDGVQGTPTYASTRIVLGLSSSKVLDRHLERLAVVYIRQSTPQQVLEHRESNLRQYGLVDYAVALGWPDDRVLVIDEDQGQSGRYAEDRHGFQQLLTEVTLDHVGIVLGLEMNRLARSDKDWHQLLEVCGVFGTLLGDQDGVYDAADPNDRLLLGLKGTISSVELQTMRNRLEKGKLNKAMRGELFLDIPVGYVKLATGELALDPDEQARAVVALIFEKFEELGTVLAVFHYLLENGVRVGIRPHDGPHRGELEWRRPTLATLYRILHHPYYAGTYVYGRTVQDPKRRIRSRKAAKTVPMDEWKVMLHDRVPAYIDWDTYLRNQERLHQNHSRWETKGTPRQGAVLFGGLAICSQCGTRMQVRYTGKDPGRYDCISHLKRGHERKCQGLQASVLDQLVEQQVLRAVEPAALELSLSACEDIQRERERLASIWQQQLERARYDSRQAERRYRAVDPDNRLVARSLEQQWEESLRNERQRQEEYDRFVQQEPLEVTPAEKDRILALANDIPALWKSPTTSAADRKEIIRCLVDRVEVHVQGTTEYVDVTIHWAGGFVSQHQVQRPISVYHRMRDYDQLVQRLREYREASYTAAQIAQRLNEEGFQSGRQKPFTGSLVKMLMSRWGLSGPRHENVALSTNELWLSDLARKLQVSLATARRWVRRGWVHFRQSPEQGYYIVWADKSEIERLGRLRDQSKIYPRIAYPKELTTPKPRPRTEAKQSKSKQPKTAHSS